MDARNTGKKVKRQARRSNKTCKGGIKDRQGGIKRKVRESKKARHEGV